MLKVYRSKQFITRSIYLTVDGIRRLIDFKGGQAYPKKIFGVFSTDSVKVQKALESHPGFNKTFELETTEKEVKKAQEVITLMEPKPEVKTEPIVLTEEVEETIEEEVEETVEEVTEEIVEEEKEEGPRQVLEVEKAQAAKLWLMNEFKNEFTHRQLANKELIIKAAKEKNVVFPNLK